MQRRFATLLAMTLAALPSVAAACPACIGQAPKVSSLRLVGAFMLVPFVVFGIVLTVIRNANRDS